MLDDIPGVLRTREAENPLPLVFDSPHSGTDYPADFDHAAPLAVLRMAEDTHVDALFGAAPRHGGALLAALFPRSYIDVNRHLADIDPELLAGPWPGEIAPGEKTKLGIGLIRRLAQPGVPVYARRLAVAEVERRIARFYRPYHAAIENLIRDRHRRFGVVWHLDCHSMASRGSAITPDGPVERSDIVLGDRDGTTCAAEFTSFAACVLSDLGYAVKLNDPYKGMELVRRYADPGAGRHSLQIEINRKLYMDEKTREPNARFERMQRDLTHLVAKLAKFARASL